MQEARVKARCFVWEKIVSFCSIHFISMNNNEYLLRNVMIPVKKFFLFWECYLSFQVAFLLNQKGFLKAHSAGYERKGFIGSKSVSKL
jgi:hypothetical protein